MSREVVKTKDIFRFINKAYPDTTHRELSMRIGIAERSYYDLRRKSEIEFYTADRILSALDMSHLLSTGDIPIITKQVTYKTQDTEAHEKELAKARARYHRRKGLAKTASGHNSVVTDEGASSA